MKLNMWNIFHVLKFDNMVPMISDGLATAHDVRLIASSYLDDNIFYVGPALDYYEADEDDVLIVHHKDMILIHNADMAEVFDELCTVVHRFDMWDESLKEWENDTEAMQKMVDISDDFVHAPLFVYGSDGQAFALSKNYDPSIHFHWADLLRDGGLSRENFRYVNELIDLPTVFQDTHPTRHASPAKLTGLVDYIHCSLFPHGQMAAHLVCFGFNESLPSGIENILATLAEHMTAHMEAYFATYNPISLLAAQLKASLLGKASNSEELRSLVRTLRWDADGQFRIICVGERDSGGAGQQVLLPGLATSIEERYSQIVVVSMDDAIILVQAVDDKTPLPDCGDSFIAGVSDTFCGIEHCRPFYLQALNEMQRARRLVTEGGLAVSHAHEHRAETVLRALPTGETLELFAAYVPHVIRDLQTYDKREDSDYYATLRAYCLSGFHPAMAAKLLDVHRNTFAYRLERMREITDLSEIDAIAAAPTLESLDYLRAIFSIADQS